MTDWFDGSYQQAVLRGFLNAGCESDASVVCFIGATPGEASDTEILQLDSPVFQLATNDSIDGLLVPVNVINNAGVQHADVFLRQFGNVPKCLLGFEREGASTVVIDNDVGMTEAVRHLIRTHRLQRIAFIRGPEGSEEAERRYFIYQQTLLENGITPDPTLALPGDFNVSSGIAAAKRLFEEWDPSVPPVEAVVAANDGMALGFIEYLETHRIRYPETVAVVGFDDVYEARLTRAPLTTVRQPIYEQGREAARLLLARLRGETQSKTIMKTELVVRRSCGCFASQGQFRVESVTAIGNRYQFDAALVEQRQRIQLELLRAGQGRFSMLGQGWEGRLLAAFVQELKGDSPNAYRRIVDDMLTKLGDAGSDPTLFHEVVSVLWERLLPCSVNSPELRSVLESLLDGSRVAICAAGQRRLGADRVHTREYSGRVIRTAMAIVRSNTLPELAQVLATALEGFHIRHLDVALFETTEGIAELRHVIACIKGKAEFPDEVMQNRDFVRRCLRGRSRAGMYVAAFGYQGRKTGLIAMDIDEDNAPLLVALVEAFATATAHGVFR